MAHPQGVGYKLFKARGLRPLLAERCSLPSATDVDAPLLLGSALFGIGWGIAGLCPGPALANLATRAHPP